MNIGIVGSEERKFTPETKAKAIERIVSIVGVSTNKVISGGCHLGGIDIWAVEVAKMLGCEYQEYLPKTKNWDGYKARNIQIAENSDVVYCLTVKTLPPGYKVKGFEKFCYHCKTDAHVKSGGCWTARYAGKLNKPFYILVIE